MQNERWLSMKENCIHFGVSRDTALKWNNQKMCWLIKSIKFGDLVYLKSMNG